jgi:hypothetical protein
MIVNTFEMFKAQVPATTNLPIQAYQSSKRHGQGSQLDYGHALLSTTFVRLHVLGELLDNDGLLRLAAK